MIGAPPIGPQPVGPQPAAKRAGVSASHKDVPTRAQRPQSASMRMRQLPLSNNVCGPVATGGASVPRGSADLVGFDGVEAGRTIASVADRKKGNRHASAKETTIYNVMV